MDMFGDIGGIVKRQMVLFFVIDTSGSMQGSKIGAVNTAIREVLPELKDAGGSDVDLKVACLTFSSGCQWMYPTPISSESFQWNQVEADGVTDLGEACRELSKKLSKNEFLKAPSGSVAPAIFLMSDGEPTDDFESGLALLKQNNWFKYAIKVAVAIGDDANKDVLAKFTGNIEAVITVHTPEALKKWIRKVSITSSQIGSKSQPVNDGQIQSKQDAMIDEIKDIQQSDPDLDSTSTSGDDW
ncbi:VWA domain-containing protein [uncultured Treponema sp.]|uniref:vWA domain-containing protein n=1 Tax=uncultured Treponema sp. TaxID=162155 RepID=UPI0025E80052|nr:VWA domain-containing protein [uncultured Treponema sp.]